MPATTSSRRPEGSASVADCSTFGVIDPPKPMGSSLDCIFTVQKPYDKQPFLGTFGTTSLGYQAGYRKVVGDFLPCCLINLDAESHKAFGGPCTAPPL